MRRILKTLWALMACAGATAPVWADSPPIAFSLTRGANGVLALSPKKAITTKAGQDQPINITCQNIDCTLITLTYAKRDSSGGVSMSPGNITKTDAQWTLTSAAVSAVSKCESGEILISQKSGVAAGDVAAPIAVAVSVPPDASCPAVCSNPSRT